MFLNTLLLIPVINFKVDKIDRTSFHRFSMLYESRNIAIITQEIGLTVERRHLW